MTTLAVDAPMIKVEGILGSVPIIANDIVYEGAMVGDNASGYGRPLVAGDKFLGHAISRCDNTITGPNQVAGAAGDMNITLLSSRYRLIVALAGAITSVGRGVYASDDATLTFTASGNSFVGVVTRYVSSTKLEVEFRPGESNINSLTADSEIWVSPDGSNAADGSMLSPLLTIAAALALCTATRKNIILMPGEYVQTASLTWPSINLVSLNGLLGQSDGVTITGVTGATEVIKIDPTIQTASFNATISNLTISAPNGVRGITFNNTNVAQKINLFLHNVAFENDTETDRAISVVHTTAGNAMRIYADGQKNIIEGLVYIEPKNTDDRFTFTNFQFDGGVQFGTTTIASVTTFKECIMKDGGGAGGQDTQILNSLGCYSLTGTTYDVAVLADFAANAAEVIKP